MKINVKDTEVMVMRRLGRAKGIQQKVTLDGVPLEQVTRFKYLESWTMENARNVEDIRARVRMAKAAFWQNKELIRRNIKLRTKMKILNYYVFSLLNFGCESWTWNKDMRKKINAFEY